ncbi:hypothetical protein BC828DRAFT_78957 [Blastocladiella britannica]|nr:hypothetical protein BC828DRAFT_78957 [Blastocladiella britannica]
MDPDSGHPPAPPPPLAMGRGDPTARSAVTLEKGATTEPSMSPSTTHGYSRPTTPYTDAGAPLLSGSPTSPNSRPETPMADELSETAAGPPSELIVMLTPAQNSTAMVNDLVQTPSESEFGGLRLAPGVGSTAGISIPTFAEGSANVSGAAAAGGAHLGPTSAIPEKDDIMMSNQHSHHRRPAAGAADIKAGLPNLLEEEEEKESSLARLQRYLENKRSSLERKTVYPPLLGDTSWWHLSTSAVFAGLALLNLVINIRIVWIVVPQALLTDNLTNEVKLLINIFNVMLLYGLLKDALRFIVFVALVFLTKYDLPFLKWGYAFIAHSLFMLPLFMFPPHRPKIIASITLFNHPNIVFWDIFFGDIPSAILSFLVNIGRLGDFIQIMTIAAIFVTTLFRLTRFLWIALLIMNEYGKRRARSLQLLKHLYLWGRGLEYYIVFLGDDQDKQKLIQHVKSRVQDFQEMKAKHIQDAWAKGFRSILILNTLQSIVSLMSGIYRFQLDKAADVSKDYPEFEKIVTEYEQELVALRNKHLWKLVLKERHIEVIKKLWSNKLVRASLQKFKTTHAEKWHERRFSRLMGVKDILDDPHQITSLLSSSLIVDEYCLTHAERILAEEYEPTTEDLEQMPISLTELLFTELCKSVSYHVKDKVLANNICILDVPKGFSRTKLQALIPFCQTLILFLDMNKFDEMVLLAKPKSKSGGANTGTTSTTAYERPPEGKKASKADRSAQQMQSVFNAPTATITTTTAANLAPVGVIETVEVSQMSLPMLNDARSGGETYGSTGVLAKGADKNGGGGGSGDKDKGTLKPRLQVELEFFERICNSKDKNNMVTGILVFWKNYSAFKARVNVPGALDNFTRLYPDYTERLHGPLNGANVIRYFKRRILRAANPGDRYVSIIPDWELNRRFDLFATLNEVIFDHYVVHRVT